MNRENIFEQIKKDIDFCDYYKASDEGINAVLDKSFIQKENLEKILSKHSRYVEDKGYVVIRKQKYVRPIDVEIIKDNINSLIYYIKQVILVDYVSPYPYNFYELDEIIRRLRYKYDYLLNVKRYGFFINKETFEDVDREIKRFEEIKNKILKECACYDGRIVCINSYGLYIQITKELYAISDRLSYTGKINSSIVEYFEKLGYKGLREEQKISKLINKILKKYNINTLINDADDKGLRKSFNKTITTLNDFCVENITYDTFIFSVNPVDFYRMSWGNSWTSCQNTDKNKNRENSRNGMYGDGCCASGTVSYMLDNSTIIGYKISEKYDGENFELEDKMERCLFHVGENFFIMGRIYPQEEDNSEYAYKQWREIFEGVLAECWNVENKWTIGENGEKYDYFYYGDYKTAYSDVSQSYCNNARWAYLKNKKPTCDNRIQIGAQPICISCGELHTNEYTLNCKQCETGEIECSECGYPYDVQDMYFIGGQYYCSDCVFYCEYHGQYEVGDMYYISNEDCYVCWDGLEYGDYYVYNGIYYKYDTDTIMTYDGTIFPYAEEAINSGYEYCRTDGEWHYIDDLTYCENCDEYVLNNDFDIEYNCCVNCLEEEV